MQSWFPNLETNIGTYTRSFDPAFGYNLKTKTWNPTWTAIEYPRLLLVQKPYFPAESPLSCLSQLKGDVCTQFDNKNLQKLFFKSEISGKSLQFSESWPNGTQSFNLSYSKKD
jgi:hypothetical protein